MSTGEEKEKQGERGGGARKDEGRKTVRDNGKGEGSQGEIWRRCGRLLANVEKTHTHTQNKKKKTKRERSQVRKQGSDTA